MREISLHILDLARNSIEAGATEIELTVAERERENRLQIVLVDNGRGMDQAAVANATNPFYTTRRTRRWGFGLSLFKVSCERCGGKLIVSSRVGEGTMIVAEFELHHFDRPPLGDMAAVIQALALEAGKTALRYRHRTDAGVFELDTRDMQRQLGDMRLTDPIVIYWLGESVRGQLHGIGSKA